LLSHHTLLILRRPTVTKWITSTRRCTVWQQFRR